MEGGQQLLLTSGLGSRVNHGLFIVYVHSIQVIDTRPIPGMVISPKDGVVSVGGTAELKVYTVESCFLKLPRETKIGLRNQG